MTPHAVHVRIARLVVDGAAADAAALARDPARLAAAIAAQLPGDSATAGGPGVTWPGAVAAAVASRLRTAGVPTVGRGVGRGHR